MKNDRTFRSICRSYPEVFLNNEKLGQKNDKLGRFGFVTRLGLNVPQLTSMLTTENKEPTNESISIVQNSQKADVFAFGVVLWEILTRQIPWNKSTYGEIEQSIRFFFFQIQLIQLIQLNSNKSKKKKKKKVRKKIRNESSKWNLNN